LQQSKAPTEGKVITFFGAKGGCGVSTVAVNMAYELHQASKVPVLLIDLDQVFNNTSVLMNIKPTHALGELSRLGAKGDPEEDVLHQLICKHESGLDVIVGSKDAQDEHDMLPIELFDKIIAKLKQKYHYIVLDLPTHVLDPYHEYLIEKSNEVLIISGLEIPALYRTRQYLDLARQYLNESKCKLVINRWNLKAAYGISNHQLSASFQYPVSFKLSNDWNLNVEANSLGCPLGMVNSKAELVKEIRAMACEIAGLGLKVFQLPPNQARVNKPSVWKRLFGGLSPKPPAQDFRREGLYALPEAVMIRGRP
jgi:pilus assembly protein CpaE